MKKVIIILVLSLASLSGFGQNLNPTLQSIRVDSLRMRGDTLWLTDGAGAVAWLRVSGDTLYLGDASGESAISSLGGGGGNITSAVPQNLATQVNKGIVIIVEDTLNTNENFKYSGDSLNILNARRFYISNSSGTISFELNSNNLKYTTTEGDTSILKENPINYVFYQNFPFIINNKNPEYPFIILQTSDSIVVFSEDRIKLFKNLFLNSGVSVNKILDEDNMASDDASALATQQSIKAYVDAQFAGSGITKAQAVDTVEQHNFQSLTSDTLILGSDTITTIGNDCFIIALSDSLTELTTANGDSWDWPYNCSIDSIQIGVNSAPTGSTLTVQITQNGTTIFSTPITIDATETTSVTAATDYTLSVTSLNWSDRMQAYASTVGSTFGGAGLKVYIYYKKD